MGSEALEETRGRYPDGSRERRLDRPPLPAIQGSFAAV